jgi:hypothetical protein
MRHAAALLLLSSLAFAGSARLYNLADGTLTNLKWKGHGHGTISGTLPSGEAISGEWVVISGGAVGWGSIYSGVYSASGTSVAVSGKRQASIVMRGDKGSVFDCEALVSLGGHGAGACKDNHENRFKLMF